MFSYFHNNFLYSLVEMQRKSLEPLCKFAEYNKQVNKKFFSGSKAGRSIGAYYELIERFTKEYGKPEFGFNQIDIDGKQVSITEEVILSKTFCRLLHFKKNSFNTKLPKMLIVAPMSGHYATLLRGTVEGLLPHFDVYITDWVNAREVPVGDGYFLFNDYVDYVIEFLRKIGSGTNVMAVCQPSVPVAAAVSIMSDNNDPATPDSMILMGGPIDTRKNPTEVNDYAAEKTIAWFESNVISRVPINYPGAGRAVYPGFTQLYGFMAMNLQTHLEAHWDLFNHLVEGDGDGVSSHKKFYNEYLSVMDLPAEFYLDTVNIVFKKHLLPRGKLEIHGQKVRLSAIEKTALLCIEGEKDDISGRGQTKAAIDLCRGIPDKRKEYLLQKGVGHYGIFNGSKYKKEIVPYIKKFVAKNAPKDAKPKEQSASKVVNIKKK